MCRFSVENSSNNVFNKQEHKTQNTKEEKVGEKNSEQRSEGGGKVDKWVDHYQL